MDRYIEVDGEIQFQISLLCYSEKSKDTISEIFEAEPTYFKENQGAEGRENIWAMAQKFYNCSSVDGEISRFLEQNSITKEKIGSMNRIGRCKVKLFVFTPYAQISFYFSESDMTVLSDLGLGLEISAISWGGVVNA